MVRAGRFRAAFRSSSACVFLLLSIVPPAGAAPGNAETPSKAAVGFPPETFKFVVAHPDDGKGDGGGWQEAIAALTIVDSRAVPIGVWTCSIKVGMPLRTKAYPQVPVKWAGETSADIATKARDGVMPGEPAGKWQPGAFCIKLKEAMARSFLEDHKGLGARVNLLP